MSKENKRETFTLIIFIIGLFLVTGIVQPSAIASEQGPIVIGATTSFQGRFKEPSEMIYQAFRLWEQQINQRGGLLGRPVKLKFYDDNSDEKTIGSLYKKLIEQDKVNLVFSPYGSTLTLAASEVSERNRYVMLAAAASAEVIWKRNYHYVFGVYALGKRYFIGQLDLMARRGYRKLALLYDSTSPFNFEVIEGAAEWASRFKMRIPFKEGYHSAEKELPGLIERLKTSGADGLIFSAYPPDCYLLLELMQKVGYKPKVLGMTIAPIHPDFYRNAGAIAEGIMGPSQWEPDERIPFPGTRRFIAAFKQYTGKMPSYHAGSAYAACQLYESAILNTQSLDNDTIRNYIATLDTVTVIGRFKVDSAGMQIGHNPILIQWQHGQKEIIWPQNMQTAKPVF